jgi:hypothetical protein
MEEPVAPFPVLDRVVQGAVASWLRPRPFVAALSDLRVLTQSFGHCSRCLAVQPVDPLRIHPPPFPTQQHAEGLLGLMVSAALLVLAKRRS